MAVDASDVDGFKPIGSFQDIKGVAKTMDCAGRPKVNNVDLIFFANFNLVKNY